MSEGHPLNIGTVGHRALKQRLTVERQIKFLKKYSHIIHFFFIPYERNVTTCNTCTFECTNTGQPLTESLFSHGA